MALQVNAPLEGGATHSNAYVRVQSARVFKKVGSEGYTLMVNVDVFVDQDERNKNDLAKSLPCPAMAAHKFEFSIGDEGSNLIGLAYTKLKTLDLYGSATDV